MDIYSLLVTRNPGAAKKKLRWCIDEPAKEQRYSVEALQQGLLIRGWVICEQTAKLQMFVTQSQTELLFPVNIKRPDVVQTLLNQPAEQHSQLLCGFSFSVPLSQDKFDIGVLVDGESVVLASVEVVGQLKVLQGDEGWLFLDNDNNSSVEQFTGKKLLGWSERRKWRHYATGLQQIAREQQVPYALLIAPSKESVYADYYPYPRGKKTIIQQLLKLVPADFKLLYPVEQLLQSDKRSYKLTDTHWSTYGARIATECLARELGVDETLLRQVFARDHYYNSTVVGDLGNKLFPPVGAKESFLDNYHYLKKRVYDNGLPNFGRIQVFQNDQAIDAGHCLIFGSSSSYSMLGYLTRIFKKLTLIHSAGNTDLALVRQLSPDYLVGQTNERFAVRAPTTDYKVAQAIAQKLQGHTPNARAQQIAKLEQKYPVTDDQVIAVLHALYRNQNG